MKTKYYCCDANRDLYEQYYSEQCGSGMPVYQGSQMQRGHGLGSILSGLFKNVWPLIRNGFKSLGRHAVKSGINIANDVVEGRSFRNSAEQRIPEGIKGFVTSQFPQSGSGKRKRITRRKKSKNKCKKVKRDIFY